MKCKFLWFVLFCTGPQFLYAQSLRLGYFGETVTHYGLRAAYEKPIAVSVSARNAKRMLYGSLGVAAMMVNGMFSYYRWMHKLDGNPIHCILTKNM